MLINGLPGDSISAKDRGLLYGDGVFRTLRVHDGRPLHWQRHYNKLNHDCAQIGIKCPAKPLLETEITQVISSSMQGVVKIIITRGASMRGYAPAANPQLTRIISMDALPDYPEDFSSHGITMHVCKLRIGHQPRLAGIKHLNRLENVLAAAEWADAKVAEGIMLDEEEHIIEGTRSNLFLVQDGRLYTPDLSKCGVAGLQRERVMEYAKLQRIVCKITDLTIDDLNSADEIFMVNSVINLWPVRAVHRYTCKHFPVSHSIQKWLNNENY